MPELYWRRDEPADEQQALLHPRWPAARGSRARPHLCLFRAPAQQRLDPPLKETEK